LPLASRPDNVSTPQQHFQRFLDEQRSEYGRSLPGKVGQIEAHWRFVASGRGDADTLAELERLAHTLAGTAGSLGFTAAGQAAKALELLVQRAMQDAAGWAAFHPDIERAVGCLQNSLRRTDPAPTDILAGTPADTSGRAKDAG
jgi:HPt (histidine-containing phosphotransfer) domain-containing protein